MELWGFLCAMIVSGLIGGAIGGRKGQPVGGFIISCLLGPVGWLIAAVSGDKRPKCPDCRGAVVPGARKCSNCGSELQAAQAA